MALCSITTHLSGSSISFAISDLNWDRLTDVAVGGIVLFIFVVVMVRVLGKRATAQMNNFDWIIAVATGSILASGILLRDISIIEAMVAMAVLGACQFVVTKIFVLYPKVGSIFKADPTLLVHKGVFLRDAMKRERISEEELQSRLRFAGLTDPAAANWVILEPDGKLSVIPRDDSAITEVECLADVEFDREEIEEVDVPDAPQ